MNESPHTETHTFPIPETEARRLDEIQHELQHQRLHRKIHDFIRANLWCVLAANCITGFLLGVCLRRTMGRSERG